jgi:two-component sensor histidine kinase
MPQVAVKIQEEGDMLHISNGPSPMQERLLMQEITHRVNNEFASAIGMVSLAAARSNNEEVKIVLNEITDLLHNYAAVHRALQMPEQHENIDAAKYLRQLCVSIRMSKLRDTGVTLELDAEHLVMPPDQCWRLGMMVHELITNAVRHAFDDRNGLIRVELQRKGHLIECRVRDNGSASPDIRAGKGTRIITELVEALAGSFEQRFSENGSTFVLTFPDYPAPFAEAVALPNSAKRLTGLR